MAENYRNIGLGIMGLHDALLKLKMVYGSKESKKFIDDIMGLMFKASVIASVNLAKEKGIFPAFNDKFFDSDILHNHFTDKELEEIGIYQYGIRNCSLLSIAPTGSLGTMLNISTGCEPLFALYYTRRTESLNGGEEKYYKVYSGVVQDYVNKYSEELPDYFVTSADIDWKDRIEMQSILQNHVDTAISSTINLPHKITIDEIEQLYLYAWEKGLKGITIFRDGCKRLGVLSNSNQETDKQETKELKRGEIIKCSDNLIGLKRKAITGCGSLHILAYFDPDTKQMLEVYLNKGSTGGCQNYMIGLSRMISLLCRAGVQVKDIKDQLDSTGVCPSYATRSAIKHDTSKGSCCPMAIGNLLVQMQKEIIEIDTDNNKKTEKNKGNINSLKSKQSKIYDSIYCPVCGDKLVFEGGCNNCHNCGYSKCD